MTEPLVDQVARERFRTEWERNFAVSANAGSGKTTAISERLAAMALADGAAERLRRTAVVTYTKKAAAQIGQRARQVMLTRIREQHRPPGPALEALDRAFFGTIHSFCLLLARTYGQALGAHLNPRVVAENDEAIWEAFLEQDAMEFRSLSPDALAAFLRHVPLEDVLAFARALEPGTADALLSAPRLSGLPVPAWTAAEELLRLPAKGTGAQNVLASQARARAWREAWDAGASFLPLYEPTGASTGLVACAAAWMAPLKRWLAEAAAVLAAELAARYRRWRFERGIQTYADQVETALAVLRDDVTLNRIREDGWRIVLDEAQDTDPQQLAVLVELARPPGAPRGAWPATPGAVPPRPGHFCLVGDGQQAIYGSRADIVHFSRHVEAYRAGQGGELLEFRVTFRAPRAVIARLNASLPRAFGPERPDNFGLPPEEGAPAPFLQVPYVPLEAGPRPAEGWVGRLPLRMPSSPPSGVDGWLEEECAQVAAWLQARGPKGLGVEGWGEVAVLAPRNDWLAVARTAFERAGLEVALQTRRLRCGDCPPYAWLTGLLAVCADPDNLFEWTGVLREVFGVSDALIAEELRTRAGLSWEEPEVHPEPLRGALEVVRRFILRVDDEGVPLGRFVVELAEACGLSERAHALEPNGSLVEELDRLLAAAAEAGGEGCSPRAWLQELLGGLEDGRPAGKPSASAINLLTSHSAKGLEWGCVIVIGCWRGIGQAPERGFRLIRDAQGSRVYFDGGSLPAGTKESRSRERVRELTRLLYVTLTRARTTLVIPWAEGFGGRQRERPSFAELWGEALAEWPELPPLVPTITAPLRADAAAEEDAPPPEPRGERSLPPLPARVLPHELAAADATRRARHEAGTELPVIGSSEEAIDYGLWWHETLEFLPWEADAPELVEYGMRALARTQGRGFGARAQEEWERLQASACWTEIRQTRWSRQAEVSVLAPYRGTAWIDGVIDLVLHDASAGEVWVVDWKTNRPRRGESAAALAARLASSYAPQLQAYGACLARLFSGARVRLWVYASAAGEWCEVPLAPAAD